MGTVPFLCMMYSRACLKNHSCNLHAPLCGRFYLHSVDVARYAALIQAKSPTNCDAHLAESLFQTRSRSLSALAFATDKKSSHKIKHRKIPRVYYVKITGRKLPLHPGQRLHPGEAEGWKPVPEDEPVRTGLLLRWLLCLYRWRSAGFVLHA